MKRKHLTPIISLALASALCVPGYAAGDVIELEYLSGASEYMYEVMEGLIDDFNETNTDNIHVTISKSPDYESVMRTRMASNNLPDIFDTHGWSVRRYGEYLYDLSNESWAEQVSPTVIDTVTDDNGKLCSMPVAIIFEGLSYNADVLTQYGIDPLSIDSMDKLEAAFETIKTESNGEVVPLYMPGSDVGIVGCLANIMLASSVGGSPVSNANALVTGEEFDWSQMATVFAKMQEWNEKGYYNEDCLTTQWADMMQAVVEGKCAFTYLGNEVMVNAALTDPELNWGFIPLPPIEELGATEPVLIGGERTGYGIWKDGENVEAARKVLEYLAQPENAKLQCEAIGAPSGLLNCDVDLTAMNECYSLYTDTTIVGQFDRTYLPNGLYNALSDGAAKVLIGSYTPDEAVEMIKIEYENLMKAGE